MRDTHTHPPAHCASILSVSPACLSPHALFSPLIADSGCTGILVQQSNFPVLSPLFTAKPLPVVPFTLPDGSVLRVGEDQHLTGELTFSHKFLPVPVYFLPESSLSHSLLGVSPLIRPQGRCVFTNISCLLFDSPQSTPPFLQGSKNPDSDLWFLQVPPPPPPNHSPAILFSLQELPCARFVAY